MNDLQPCLGSAGIAPTQGCEPLRTALADILRWRSDAVTAGRANSERSRSAWVASIRWIAFATGISTGASKVMAGIGWPRRMARFRRPEVAILVFVFRSVAEAGCNHLKLPSMDVRATPLLLSGCRAITPSHQFILARCLIYSRPAGLARLWGLTPNLQYSFTLLSVQSRNAT